MNTIQVGMNATSIADDILEAMKSAIQQYGLEVLQRYPNDLLVHDKAFLDKMAVPGAKIGWVVGHLHTHVCALGLHKEENKTATYLTNLSSGDHFFVIKVHQGRFTMGHLAREAFSDLSLTEVPYERQGLVSDFWLCGRHKKKVGYIALKNIGTFQQPKVSATITPVAGIKEIDRAALDMWCSRSIIEMAHTLFVQSEVVWADACQINEQSDQQSNRYHKELACQ